MQFSSFSYDELSIIHGIARDYVEKAALLRPFISAFPDPLTIAQAAESRAENFAFRQPLHAALVKQYEHVADKKETMENIEALKEKHSVTITTGHQICLATGPLFVIYKIAGVIAACRELNAQSKDITYVPVYWMATEDHDLEEIAHFFRNSEKRLWQTPQTGAVGRMVPNEVNELFFDIKEPYGDWLKQAYQQPTMAEAMRSIVHRLFGKYGLVIIDADRAELKALFAPSMLREIRDNVCKGPVNKASEELSSLGYSPQVTAKDINLFWLNENQRERIEIASGGEFQTHLTRERFSLEDLEHHLHLHPERFSPNVILRPIYQEYILPNVAYIGGPGELAYWLQLKEVFDAFELPMPVVMLRNNALIVSAALQDRINKLGWSLTDFFLPVSEQEKRIFGELPQHAFQRQRHELKQVFNHLHDVLGDTDTTLRAAVRAEEKKAQASIDMLEKKWHKALKQKEETKHNQWKKIRSQLFPQDQTQDRTTNVFDFPQLLDQGLIDELIRAFQPFRHRYVCLLE